MTSPSNATKCTNPSKCEKKPVAQVTERTVSWIQLHRRPFSSLFNLRHVNWRRLLLAQHLPPATVVASNGHFSVEDKLRFVSVCELHLYQLTESPLAKPRRGRKQLRDVPKLSTTVGFSVDEVVRRLFLLLLIKRAAEATSFYLRRFRCSFVVVVWIRIGHCRVRGGQ